LLDGEHGLSLCHHVYPGNVADAVELPAVLERVGALLDATSIPRESVTLVFDRGTAALRNTVLLTEARLGWISALPWNQAPPDLRDRPVEQLPVCSSEPAGVRAAAQLAVVHGAEYLCVLGGAPDSRHEYGDAVDLRARSRPCQAPSSCVNQASRWRAASIRSATGGCV
jgi:hypothetical protein